MRVFLQLAVALSVTATVAASEVKRTEFGALPDGRRIEALSLTNERGVAVRLLTYGATVQSVFTPDAHGRSADIALGFDTLAGYVSQTQYFGATVGRYANRIANGQFMLAGRTYSLPVNDGSNTLHGGKVGFDRAVWEVLETRGGPEPTVILQHVSPDGDQGFPGRLTVNASFSLNARNELVIEYTARTDSPTVVNITNHAYWNLAGESSGRSVSEHLLMIPADRITPVDATLIPTGTFLPVQSTPFDFRTLKSIGQDLRDGRSQQMVFGRGYDHNWVISAPPGKLRLVARVEDPYSGRTLEVFSDQPGLQFYSSNFLNATTPGKGARLYRQGDGLALEPQRFPDTVNRPAFGSARLDPGQEYRHRIVFRFGRSGL